MHHPCPLAPAPRCLLASVSLALALVLHIPIAVAAPSLNVTYSPPVNIIQGNAESESYFTESYSLTITGPISVPVGGSVTVNLEVLVLDAPPGVSTANALSAVSLNPSSLTFTAPFQQKVIVVTVNVPPGHNPGDYAWSIRPASWPAELNVTDPGAGINARPIRISSAAQLDAVRNGLSGSYVLDADFDLSLLPSFAPIGSASAPFTGMFHGHGHTLSNWSGTSFFGVTGPRARISDLAFTGASVSGTEPTGGLIGENQGAIIDVIVTGSVSGTKNTGGLVGLNTGSITDSVAAVSVTATDENAGGLTGENRGIVQRTHAAGAVTGTTRVGGLAGLNTGSVSTSFATGAVSGASELGGLLGFSSGYISNTYATGSLDGAGTALGGLIGALDGPLANSFATGAFLDNAGGGLVGAIQANATVASSYWDTQASGQSTSAGGIGHTTTELQQQATFAGWDFANIWSLAPDAYPAIRADADPLPIIFGSPRSLYLLEGDGVQFDVYAAGPGPLSYQWRYNGDDIPGATTQSLELGAFQIAMAGSYDVVLTNPAGTVASRPATLGLALPPTIVTQPQSQTGIQGSTVTFSVVADSNASPYYASPSYQWWKNGTEIVGSSKSLILSNIGPANAADYSVVVSNIAGSVTSSIATLTVITPPQITTQPLSQVVAVGSGVTFTVTATSSYPLSYQWQKDGIDISGATSASFAIASTTLDDDGNYRAIVSNIAGSVASSIATLTITTPPQITLQPLSQVVAVGSDVTFTVAATSSYPHSYQWQKDGIDISGATSASFSIASTTLDDSGDYRAIVSNIAGSVASNAGNLSVLAPVPPSITSHPESSLIVVGSNLALTVECEGSPPFTFQWQKNGTDLPSQTDQSLLIENVSAADAGDYRVIVSNAVGTATSNAATITVVLPVTITTQPLSQSTVFGSNVTFSVVATGSVPISYQWQKDAFDIPGANSSSYTILSVNPTDLANYEVTVSNSVSSEISDAALLTVTSPQVTAVDHYIVTAGDPGFTLTVTGVNFAPTAQVRWNGTARPTQYVSGTELTADISASDIALTSDIATALVTVENPANDLSNALAVTIQSSIVTEIQTELADEGATVTVSTAPTAPENAGASATLENNTDGSAPATLTVATYDPASNPTSVPYFDVGGGFLDVQVSGADSADIASVNFYYPSTIIGQTETDLTLLYFDGASWLPVLSSGGAVPAKDTSDNLDGTVSGGRFTVVLDGTSTPPITGLGGTVFTFAPPPASGDSRHKPKITTQPEDQTVTTGSDVTFSVTVAPGAPVTYQWRLKNQLISGTTSATLVRSNVTSANAGDYVVTVTNAKGSTTSKKATLTVLPHAPVIAVPPQSQSANSGASVTLSVTATSEAPVTYQWLFNGKKIGGEKGATLTLTKLKSSDSGAYSVVVSNDGGSVTSAAATVTVLASTTRR